jgi:hypothetical protein
MSMMAARAASFRTGRLRCVDWRNSTPAALFPMALGHFEGSKGADRVNFRLFALVFALDAAQAVDKHRSETSREITVPL